MSQTDSIRDDISITRVGQAKTQVFQKNIRGHHSQIQINNMSKFMVYIQSHVIYSRFNRWPWIPYDPWHFVPGPPRIPRENPWIIYNLWHFAPRGLKRQYNNHNLIPIYQANWSLNNNSKVACPTTMVINDMTFEDIFHKSNKDTE